MFKLDLGADLEPGSEPVPITEMTATNLTSPVWLPGGDGILLSTGRLALAPVRRGAPLQNLGVDRRIEDLAYNAASNRLVYSVNQSEANVWGVALSGPGEAVGAPVPVIRSSYLDQQASLSPDGSRIAFWSSRTGEAEVWIADRDGSNAVQITQVEGAGISHPRWSPDGRKLLFASGLDDANFDLYAIPADGGKMERLTIHPAFDRHGEWDPDMEWIYFQSTRGGDSGCYRMPSEGGEAARVVDGVAALCGLSPDGTRLYYRPDRLEDVLAVMPLDGGEPTRIELGFAYRFFEPAETGAYFLSGRPEGPGTVIRYLEFESGETHTVVETSVPPLSGLSVSRDQSFLVWGQQDRAGSDLMLIEDFH